MAGLPDESAAFQAAVRNPIDCRPLREQIKATDKVAVVIPDITRPLPTERLLPWLFAELSHVPAENFVIVNGTGSHRANTPAELATMCSADIAKKFTIVNHNSCDPSTLKPAGIGDDGQPVLYNKEYCEADKRIVMGFVEPHFMAGFSGVRQTGELCHINEGRRSAANQSRFAQVTRKTDGRGDEHLNSSLAYPRSAYITRCHGYCINGVAIFIVTLDQWLFQFELLTGIRHLPCDPSRRLQ